MLHFGFEFGGGKEVGVGLVNTIETVVRDLGGEGEVQFAFERSQEASEFLSAEVSVFVLVEVIEAEVVGLLVLFGLESEV